MRPATLFRMLPGSNGFISYIAVAVAVAVAVFVLGLVPTATGARAADVEAALEKANVYIELSKTTERAVESWDRYQSWVNMKTGPTGAERYIDYGLYELNDAPSALAEAREMAAKPPTAAKLDAAILRYLTAYEALAPVMNEAANYYDSKGYASDKMARGKALHTAMVPLATAFLAEREAMMPDLRVFVRDVEGQEVEALSTRDSASVVSHVAAVMHHLNRVIDVFPRVRPQQIGSDEMEAMMDALGPDTPGETFDKVIAGATVPKTPPIDVAAFDAASKSYGEAVARLDAFNGKLPEDPDDFNEFKPMPQQMLGMLTAFREPLARSKGEEFEGGGQMMAEIYNHYIEMLNASSPIGISRLRYLP